MKQLLTAQHTINVFNLWIPGNWMFDIKESLHLLSSTMQKIIDHNSGDGWMLVFLFCTEKVCSMLLITLTKPYTSDHHCQLPLLLCQVVPVRLLGTHFFTLWLHWPWLSDADVSENSTTPKQFLPKNQMLQNGRTSETITQRKNPKLSSLYHLKLSSNPIMAIHTTLLSDWSTKSAGMQNLLSMDYSILNYCWTKWNNNFSTKITFDGGEQRYANSDYF